MTRRNFFWITLCSALLAINAMVDGGLDEEVEKFEMLKGDKLRLTEVYQVFENRFKARDCYLICDSIMSESAEKYCACGIENEEANRKLAGYLDVLGHQILEFHNITDKVASKDESLLFFGFDGKKKWFLQGFFSALHPVITAGDCPVSCKWIMSASRIFRKGGVHFMFNTCGCRLVDVELDVKLANEAIIIANTMHAFYDDRNNSSNKLT